MHNTFKNKVSKYIFLVCTLTIFNTTFLKAQTFEIISGDTINNLDKDSLKQGLWREFYKTTGNIKAEVYYLNGQKEGLEIIWNNIPHCIQYEATYKNGKLNGPVYKYSKWCNIEREENYKNGVSFGFQRTYYPNGQIKSEAEFKNGELKGTYKTYDKNGNILFESKTEGVAFQAKDSVKTDSPILSKLLSPPADIANKLIVTDITGSMYPYAKQVINWYEKYLEKNATPLCFVFFNDGDKKPQVLKTMGNAGGVYFNQSNDLSEIVRTMTTAANNGGGGDLAENNIEAILTGLKEYPKTKTVIMLGDNTAPVRDIELLKRVKKPVKIILCAFSSKDEVNIDFIKIAYLTKGSLHTFDKDLYDFSNEDTKGVVEINKFNYVFSEGRVTKL